MSRLIQLFTLFFLSFGLLSFGCGGQKETKIVERSTPKPGDTNPNNNGDLETGTNPGGSNPTGWARIQSIMKANCEFCHSGAGFLESRDVFLRGSAVRRIENRTMPPQNSPKYNDWSEALRNEVLLYARSQ